MTSNAKTEPEQIITSSERKNIDQIVIERLLAHLTDLEDRISETEIYGTGNRISSRKKSAPGRDIESRISALQSELIKVNNRAASMRLDRQFRLAVLRILSKIIPGFNIVSPEEKMEHKKELNRVQTLRKMTVEAPFAILCGAYPGGDKAYGGQFIKSRLDFYYRNGLKPVVIEVSPHTKELIRHQVDGVDVLRVNSSGLSKVMRLSKVDVFGVHSIEKPMWKTIQPFLENKPLFVWVHGFEARAWEELSFNFSEEELLTLRPRLDNANDERRETMSEVMTRPNTHMIYVSNYMRTIAENFAQEKADQPYVIPNPVDPITFPYSAKSAEARKSILWLRSFSAHNYASDISRDVILGLSEMPWFSELKITIVGQGKYFEDITEPLKEFTNITLREEVVDREEMLSLFNAHGVKLVPSRWDSQGLTACEAMHAGLVPLTTSVAGLSEYIDEDSAVIAKLDESQALIDGYVDLYTNPGKYIAMSEAAHKKSAQLCGPSNTTVREMDLIQEHIEALMSSISRPTV